MAEGWTERGGSLTYRNGEHVIDFLKSVSFDGWLLIMASALVAGFAVAVAVALWG